MHAVWDYMIEDASTVPGGGFADCYPDSECSSRSGRCGDILRFAHVVVRMERERQLVTCCWRVSTMG